MKKLEITQARWIASMMACALIGSVAGSIGLSFADGNRSTTNMINNVNKIVVPYDGYLMLDSTPVTGVQKMRFTLYESPSGNSGQWAEAHNVSVNDGRFSVTLGNGNNVLSSTPGAPSPLPHSTFNDAILDAQKLYIGIEVEDANNPGSYILLAGRQAIEAAPFAAWSARSADFGVEGGLSVKGVARVDGEFRPQAGIAMANDTSITGADQIVGFNDLRLSGSPNSGAGNLVITNVGDVLVSNSLGVSGTTSLNSLHASAEVRGSFLDGVLAPRYQNWNTTALGAGGASIYNDNGTYKALMITGNNSGAQERQVRIFDDLTVERHATVSSDLTVSGEYKNLAGSMTLSTYTKSDNGDEFMIGKDSGFCFLTGMTTGGAGTGDRQCSVYRGTNDWVLFNNEVSPNFVNCTAACIEFAQ